MEPSKVAKKSEWKFEQKGGRERCFAFYDDLSDLMMDNRMTDQERHSHAEAILTILHEYAIFCPYKINGPVDMLQCVLSFLTSEQRATVFAVQSTLTGATPLHCAVMT